MFIDRITNTMSITKKTEEAIVIEHRPNHTISNSSPHKTSNSLSDVVQFGVNTNYRIQAWLASINIIKNSFPLGTGKNITPLLEKNLTSPSSILSTVPFHHFHNQIINSLAFNGVLGLAFVLILLTYPIFCHIKYKNEASIIFAATSIVYIVASITDIPLGNKPTLCFYLTMFIIYQHYDPTHSNIGNKLAINNNSEHLDHASHI
ncbi:hypothetical protein MACH09_01540 [Vibrio sp. MACH09]|nr:hypothetical protein MACH09_01540 [Vibrio sp. MACH09]